MCIRFKQMEYWASEKNSDVDVTEQIQMSSVVLVSNLLYLRTCTHRYARTQEKHKEAHAAPTYEAWTVIESLLSMSNVTDTEACSTSIWHAKCMPGLRKSKNCILIMLCVGHLEVICHSCIEPLVYWSMEYTQHTS